MVKVKLYIITLTHDESGVYNEIEKVFTSLILAERFLREVKIESTEEYKLVEVEVE